MKEIIYKTRNLYEAALLYAENTSSFTGLEPDGRDYLFLFQGEQCQLLADNFYTGRATTNAKAYSDAIRTLKDIIFNRLREQRANRGEG